ncbi:MAG TPA: hypothetical protein VM284_04520 [Candidatus Limnocylindria bacterium]|nr:hypothetical protein [Candidatus Limnocylindria bacterium]
MFAGLRRPRVHLLGLDVAGLVESVGEEATRFKVGDRVFGDLYAYGQGAFAEYVCAPEKAFELIPADMSFETAACLPHSAVLAVLLTPPVPSHSTRTRSGDSYITYIIGSSLPGSSRGKKGPFRPMPCRRRRANEALRLTRAVGECADAPG